jgi:flagellar hook-length control protein FliK
MLRRLELASPTAQAAKSRTLRQGVEQAALSSLSLALQDGEGTATVRLAPADLGQLALRLHVRDGEVSLQAQTQTESARDLLNASLPALRDALEAKGLHVRELHVQGPEAHEAPSRAGPTVQDAQPGTSRSDQDDRSAGGEKSEGQSSGGGASNQQSSAGHQGSGRTDAHHALQEALQSDQHAERATEPTTFLPEAGVLQWIA